MHWKSPRASILLRTLAILAVLVGLGPLQSPDPVRGTSAEAELILTQVHHLGGSFQAVQVVDERAYVATGAGLYILNISDPTRPLHVGKFVSAWRADGLDVAGSYVYLPQSYGGLIIIDASDPTRPSQVGAYSVTGGAIEGVDVIDRYAYAAVRGGVKGLFVLDLSDPTHPRKVGHALDDRDIWDVQVVESYAYIVGSYAYAYSDHLSILDVSDPTQPREIGVHELPFWSLDVELVDHLAYVAYSIIPGTGGGLIIFDVSDPTQPRQLGEYRLGSGYVTGVRVSGTRAYLFTDDVLILDVTDPTHPRRLGAVNTPGDARGADLVGNTLYLADGSGGLQIIHVLDPNQPRVIGAYPTLAPEGTLLFGEYMYLVEGDAVHILDLTDPAHPQWVGTYRPILPGLDRPRIRDMAAVEGYLFLATDIEGLRVIDVSDPRWPQGVGQLAFGSGLFTVAVAGNHAYVGGPDGAWVVDITDPSRPQQVAELPLDIPGETPPGAYRTAYRIRIRETTAYVLGFRIWAIDISDPTQPRLLGISQTGVGASADADLEGDRLYSVAQSFQPIGGLRGWLYITDISDPIQPQVVATHQIDPPYGVDAVSTRLYIPSRMYGLQVIDVSDPSQLQRITVSRPGTPGWVYGVSVSGDWVYLAHGGGGFSVTKLVDLSRYLYLPLVAKELE